MPTLIKSSEILKKRVCLRSERNFSRQHCSFKAPFTVSYWMHLHIASCHQSQSSSRPCTMSTIFMRCCFVVPSFSSHCWASARFFAETPTGVSPLTSLSRTLSFNPRDPLSCFSSLHRFWIPHPANQNWKTTSRSSTRPEKTASLTTKSASAVALSAKTQPMLRWWKYWTTQPPKVTSYCCSGNFFYIRPIVAAAMCWWYWHFAGVVIATWLCQLRV